MKDCIFQKHLSKLLCIVCACLIVAGLFISAAAMDDPSWQQESTDLSLLPTPTPTPMPVPDEGAKDSVWPDETPSPSLQPDAPAPASPMETPAVPPVEDGQPEPTTAPSPEPNEPESTPSPEKAPEEGEQPVPSPQPDKLIPAPPPVDTPEEGGQPDGTLLPITVQPDEDEEAVEIEGEYPPEETAAAPIPDYPPAWAESGQAYINGNLMVAEQIRLLQGALHERIGAIRHAFSMPEDTEVTSDPENLMDVFAIYAVRHGMTENFPYNVVIDSQTARDELWSIYWDLTRVHGTVKYVDGQKAYSIHVSRSSFAEEQERYAFSIAQQEALKDLHASSAADSLLSQLDNSILSTLTDEEFAQVQSQLAGVSGERRAVLLAALSLENKVDYFWGGKSYHVGWDNRWGQMRTVTSDDSEATGTARPFGMDCSGFVSWAFINAGGSKETLAYIGNGSANQWRNAEAIAWGKLLPGDIVFYKNPASSDTNHVGIVVGRDADSSLRVVHCSSSRNGVVVTGAAGFQYAKRPYLYTDS